MTDRLRDPANGFSTVPIGMPQIFDGPAGDRTMDAVGAAIAASGETIRDQDKQRLHAIASCSPYLARLMARHPDWLVQSISSPLGNLSEKVCQEVARLDGDSDYDAIKQHLRRAKDKMALAIAIHDLTNLVDTMTATQTLSAFADCAVQAALLAAWHHQESLGNIHPGKAGQGLVVLAMGKHGAGELNYSSDIDLVALFEAEKMPIVHEGTQSKTAIAIVRDMVALLSDQTGDGYVFRTDLRLRPDPGVTNIAIPIRAAELYYESHGQNWERAAFIKARPIAGDVALGENFLENLRPFIWRKYLDYAALADIDRILVKIRKSQGDGKDDFTGYDVKLGIGGIRSIEFLVQSRQLVSGGKVEALRIRQTLAALERLSEGALIEPGAADHLARIYTQWRTLEHRIQMLGDEQTHKIPANDEEIHRLACFCGFGDGAALEEFVSTLRAHSTHYQALALGMDDKEHASSEVIDLHLDFSGVDDHEQTLETLAGLGFTRPNVVSAQIRRWLSGAYRSTRSERGRLLLTSLLPRLLSALGEASDPDAAFVSFDRFLGHVPSGVQLFSMFDKEPEIFRILIAILTTSPRLAAALSRQQGFTEALIDKGWLGNDGDLSDLKTQLAQRCEGEDFEGAMNVTRRLIGEAQFNDSVALASGQLGIINAGARFTQIARCGVEAIERAADKAMHESFGTIEGRMAVIGFGRLGANRMTCASDVDIVFVYDTPLDSQSDGKRRLDGTTWYTRKVRRLVTGLSAATEEGELYNVDMQLRPSGGAGPAAVKLSAFKKYYEEDAWAWELMALTKAKTIGGDASLCAEIENTIEEILATPRDEKRLAHDVADMRARLLREKPAQSIWDRKSANGGLTDLEFLLQFLILTNKTDPKLFHCDISELSNHLQHHSKLAASSCDLIQDAFILYETILQISRLGAGAVFSPDQDGQALGQLIAKTCGEPSLGALEERLKKVDAAVRSLFVQIVST